MINENLMNPIPLHASKSLWYCKKKTFHDANVGPLAPVGKLLPTILTVDNSAEVTNTVLITIAAPDVLSGSFSASGDVMGSFPIDYVSTVHTVRIEPVAHSNDLYKVFYQKSGVPYKVMYDNSDSISGDLLRSENVTCGLYDSLDEYEGTFTWVSPLLSAEITLTAALFPCGSDDVGGFTVTSYTANVARIPHNLASSDKWANIIIPAKTMSGMPVGRYYLRITFDNVNYYSEPFEWYSSNDGRNIVRVAYRRTSPIVTSKNYIPFHCGGQNVTMEMYLPTYLMKPPYKFDSEIEELDGWKFVNKQVSYHQDRCEFLCTQYFAEAIRLLWHSNERTINNVAVDFMEKPEIDWNTDNHLCQVVLLFQSDTIVQTNGEAIDQVSASDGTSFNGSFNPSFS